MNHNMKRFEAQMEIAIGNLFEKIKTKEKMVEIQDRLIKFQTEEIEKLKVKLYKKALRKFQQQPESTLKVIK
ncbi:MAG: hypothetical protein KAI40_11050 [Desulfobacterales bacterium]|nr:hypothetical protein [Desulfobacterales bacterium]